MLRSLAVSLIAIGLALPALAHHGVQQAANREVNGWPLESFTLTDHDGRDFTQDRLHGRWTFVLFGDTTACEQRCDSALRALTALCKRIATADVMKTTQILFISLDPHHDTPARLREYLATFDTRFVGATAAPATLQRLADDIGVRVGDVAAQAGNQSAARHYPGSVLLIGPDATLRAEYLPPLDVLRLTSSYLRTRYGGR